MRTRNASRAVSVEPRIYGCDVARAGRRLARRPPIDQRIDQLTVDSERGKGAARRASRARWRRMLEHGQQRPAGGAQPGLLGPALQARRRRDPARRRQQKYTPAAPGGDRARASSATALIAQIASQPSAVVSQTTVAPNPLYQSLQQQAATYRARIQGDQGQVTVAAGPEQAARPTVKSLPQEAVAVLPPFKRKQSAPPTSTTR